MADISNGPYTYHFISPQGYTLKFRHVVSYQNGFLPTINTVYQILKICKEFKSYYSATTVTFRVAVIVCWRGTQLFIVKIDLLSRWPHFLLPSRHTHAAAHPPSMQRIAPLPVMWHAPPSASSAIVVAAAALLLLLCCCCCIFASIKIRILHAIRVVVARLCLPSQGAPCRPTSPSPHSS